MEFSRRGFLFGLGATLAATQIPFDHSVTVIEIPPAPKLLWRDYFDIAVSGMDPSYRDVIDIKILRGETPIFSMPMFTNSAWRWVAPPVQGIIVPPDEFLNVSISRPESMTVALHFKEMRESWNKARTFVEIYRHGEPRSVAALEDYSNG